MGAALISSVSCKDFLVEDPKGQFTTANFLNSVEEVDMAVCAIYSRVRWSQNCTDPVGMAWQGDDIPLFFYIYQFEGEQKFNILGNLWF